MLEMIKKKNLEEGLDQAIEKASQNNFEILFSYSFRFDIRDLLPMLSHPSDKNTVRTYWEQPSEGFSFAGLGNILEFVLDAKKNSENINTVISSTMKKSISVSENSLIGPRIIGGFAFGDYHGEDDTWDDFPRKYFVLPECLGTATDDGAWLTISRMIQPKELLIDIIDELIKKITFFQNRLPVTLPPISRVAIDKFQEIPNRERYSKILFSILENIKPDQLEKVVISRSHHVKVGKEFSVISAMQVLRNVYSNCTSFFFSTTQKRNFLWFNSRKINPIEKSVPPN